MIRVAAFLMLGSLCACSDPAVNPANALGGSVDLVACAEVQAETPKLLAQSAPTRAELQVLIERSAKNCPVFEHGVVVSPICADHPDACTGELEEDLR